MHSRGLLWGNNYLKQEVVNAAGQGVVLDSERPHLVLIDDNLLTTGVTLYHLNHGRTTIGSLPTQDIKLEVITISCNLPS